MSRATALSPDRRRAALIAATEPLLEVHGRAVTTRQIADAAGIAEGTIFRVFPTKEALIEAVVAETLDIGPTCDAVERVDPTLPLAGRLVAVAEILQARLRRVFNLLHAGALTHPSEPAEEFHARIRADNGLLDAAIASVIKPDEQQLRVDPEGAAGLLRIVTFSATHPVLSDQRHADPRELVQILLHGIAHHDPPGEDRAGCLEQRRTEGRPC